MNEIYIDLLRESEEKWGASEGMGDRMIQPVETLRPEWRQDCKIGIFQFNGQWGYCLSVARDSDGAGHWYGPFLKFSDPYPSRREALESAIVEFVSFASDKRLISWAHSLLAKQLPLWAEVMEDE